MDPIILHEDSDMLVVSKPAGMVVNKADSAKGNKTLQEWAESYLNLHSFTPQKPTEAYMVDGYSKYDEFINRGGVVHRLDKETSGIVLIAKTPEVFINLQNQFKEGSVSKTYTTLVHGTLEKTEAEIEAPIGRLPWNRMRFGVYPEGRAAKTLYKVVEVKESDRSEQYSLVEVYPKTGRTHQIRVHFKYIGNPIFGDELYAGRKTGRTDRKTLPRHFLHAAKISLNHPSTGNKIEFESQLPVELENVLKTLKTV